MHNLFFYDKSGCAQIFKDQGEYELHCFRGVQDNQELQQNVSMQDKIKNSNVSLMKISAPISSIMNVSLGSSYVEKIMDMACAEYPVMEYLNKEGWAQPVGKNFRYSEDQKKILYGLFIKGQKSKKKATPEEAVAKIRKKLPIDQFVKPK